MRANDSSARQLWPEFRDQRDNVGLSLIARIQVLLRHPNDWGVVELALSIRQRRIAEIPHRAIQHIDTTLPAASIGRKKAQSDANGFSVLLIHARGGYFAYSTARVSRMTVTLIWPG